MKPLKRIQILDSLRGIAAILVVIHHLFSLNHSMLEANLSIPIFDILNWISDRNVEAVLFFFLLSGFSIGLSLRNSSFNDKGEINHYIYRRVKRIFPLYWLALVLSIVVLVLQPHIYNESFSLKNLIGNLLFLQKPALKCGWFIKKGDNGPLWSLSYEVFFYAIAIPLIFLRAKFLTKWTPIFGTIASLFLAILMIAVQKFAPNPFASFLALFPIWVIGFELSQIYLAKRKEMYFLILLAGFYLISFIVERHLLPSDTLKVLNLGVLISLLGYVLAICQHQPKLHSIFKPLINILNSMFYKIGTASFSIYIFHYILLKTLKLFNCGLMVQVVCILLLIPFCFYLEKWFVKQPFHLFKRKYV